MKSASFVEDWYFIMAGKIGLAAILLIMVVLHLSVQFAPASFCNDSLYSSTKHGYTRHTVIHDGDFMLQGIFSQTSGSDCITAAREGVLNVAVMQLAIEHVEKSNILPGYRLGYQFDNGCVDIPKVMERGIEIVSMYRPNSVCRADFLDCKSNPSGKGVKPISAVIGPGYSFLTIPLASLMGLYNIPHVSYQASSRLLSKSNLYKSFFRTIPSDSNQVLVMLDIIKKFNWNYLFAIGSDDDYGKLGISALKESAQSQNVCIAYDAYIPNSGSNVKAKVLEIVNRLKSTPKAKLVVLFTYSSMGEMILQEAEKNKIRRLWLTSDAWSARGPSLNVSKDYLAGIVTVATEKTIIPGFESFLEKKIKTEALCDPWLASYLRQTYFCTFHGQNMNCPSESPASIAKKMLAANSGGYGNLYDAVFALSHGINAMLKLKCDYKSANYNKSKCAPFAPKDLLKHMYNVSFQGVFKRSVAFDSNGDPKSPHYIIENIQDIQGHLKYVQIGTWDKVNDKGRLEIDVSKIQWPHPNKNIPDSKCSRDCVPGEYVHAKTECCWSCQDCDPLHISKTINSPSCTACPKGHHTDIKRTECRKTPIVYLTASMPGGIAIVTVSCIGLFVVFVFMAIFLKIRESILVQESQPAILVFSLFLLFLSFTYGITHVTKPNNSLCSARSAYFFMLFGTFAGLLLAQTILIKDTLTEHVNKYVTVKSPIVQYAVLLLVIFLELITVLIWVQVDPVKMMPFPTPGNTQLFLECKVELTISRMICMSLPCITLVVTMVIAFRERNEEHPFNEPKFLSFTTIAIAIIVVAFIPTFKYVVGIYKAIVMAFTVDLCTYTYIGCMFVPKLYAIITQGAEGGVISENQMPEAECSIHELNRCADTPGNSTHNVNGSSDASTTHAKYVCKESIGKEPEVYLLKSDGVVISKPPSPLHSDSTGTHSRRDSETGSGSHLMTTQPVFV